MNGLRRLFAIMAFTGLIGAGICDLVAAASGIDAGMDMTAALKCLHPQIFAISIIMMAAAITGIIGYMALDIMERKDIHEED